MTQEIRQFTFEPLLDKPKFRYTRTMELLDHDYRSLKLDLDKAVEVWEELIRLLNDLGIYTYHTLIQKWETHNEVTLELAINETMSDYFNIDDHPFRFATFKDFIRFMNEDYHKGIFDKYIHEMVEWKKKEEEQAKKEYEEKKLNDKELDRVSLALQVETLSSLIKDLEIEYKEIEEEEEKESNLSLRKGLVKKIKETVEHYMSELGGD